MNYKKRTKILALILGLATVLASSPLIAAPVELERNSNIIERLKSKEDVFMPKIDKFQNKRNVSVVVDGVDKTSQIPSDQKPIITDKGVTYVSVKMFETIISNVYLDYTAKDSLVRVNYKDKWIYVMLGKPIAFKAHPKGSISENFTVDNRPTTVNGRTYLPLRFAVESLGCLVVWDGKTNTIGISTTGEAPVMPKAQEVSTGITGKKVYWGGKQFIQGNKDENLTVHIAKEPIFHTFMLNGIVMIQCTTVPKFEFEGEVNPTYFVGNIRFDSDYRHSFDKQCDEALKLLTTIVSKEQAVTIINHVRKHLNSNTKSESEISEYGEYVIETVVFKPSEGMGALIEVYLKK